MGKPRAAGPVKLIVGLLGGDADLLRRARQLLKSQYGPTDLESELWPFVQTNFYEPEMGPGLLRWFVAFESLVPPDRLVDIKRETNDVEERITQEAMVPDIPRPVNIDPGYVDLSKLVLATTKDRAHRLYLGGGIYGEVTLQFMDGAWQPWPWTYPDYREPRCHEFFVRVRERLNEQLRAGPAARRATGAGE